MERRGGVMGREKGEEEGRGDGEEGSFIRVEIIFYFVVVVLGKIL